MKFTRRNAATSAGNGRRTRRGAAPLTHGTPPPRRSATALPEPLEGRTLFAFTFTDDFNDGVDDGWTKYDPIRQAGGPAATYEFVGQPGPNLQYRIATTQPSPNPGALGPSRAGAFRADVFEDFLVSVDLIDWNSNLVQAFGILARTSTPGLGSTDGYALSYSTNGDLDISLVVNEAPDDLDPSVDIFLDPSKDYRLEFEGRGSRLIGRLYDLENPTVAIATTSAVDTTYTRGQNGIFVFDNTSTADSTADATFDNFRTGTPDAAIAYWRFETELDPTTFPPNQPRPVEPGQEFLAPTSEGGPDSGLSPDSAGGDDQLRTFFDTTNPVYRADVPGATTAAELPNTRSLEFTPNEDLYTARPGTLNAHPLDQFTIEASFKTENSDRWQVILGKDGKPTDLAIAPFQMKVRNDLGAANDVLSVEYIAVGPDNVPVERRVDTLLPVEAGVWYNVAAVMNGTTLSLYLDDTRTPEGYVLQNTVDVPGGMVRSDATWTVGRGYFNGGIADWFDGFIDEVRISDRALDPSQFVFAQPDTGGDVQAMYVSGTAWSDSFKQYLQDNNLGSAQYGFEIRNGAPGLDELPWSNINQISLTLDDNTSPAQGDLVVNGFVVPQYTVTGMTWNPATRTATWTLQQPLANYPTERRTADRVSVAFRGDDFTQDLNVVPGDANRNGNVSPTDYGAVRSGVGRSTTDPGTAPTNYTAFKDVNANGNVSPTDIGVVRGNTGANIDNVPIPAPAPLTGRSSVSADFFSQEDLLA